MADIEIENEDASDLLLMTTAYTLAIDEEVTAGNMTFKQQGRIMRRAASIANLLDKGEAYEGTVTSNVGGFLADLNKEEV